MVAPNLTTALRSAQSGIKSAQELMSLSASNISKLNVKGASREVAHLETSVSEGITNVQLSRITRQTDENVIKILRVESSSKGSASIESQYFDEIQQFLGKPDDKESLSHGLDKFIKATDTLAFKPADSGNRVQFVQAASALARKLNSTQANIQALREKAESEIDQTISLINKEIKNLEALNEQFITYNNQGIPLTALEDARDEGLSRLASLINIQVTHNSNATFSVTTASGLPLVQTQPYSLDYAKTSNITPESTFGAISVKTASGTLINIADDIKGGKLKGLITMRDEALPKLQEQIDQFAAKLRDEVNAIHNKGTSFPPPNSLQGNRSFANPLTDAFTGTGSIRLAVIDQAGLYVRSSTPIDLSTFNTLEELRLGLQTELGADATVSFVGGKLQITATSGLQGIGIVDLAGPTTATSPGHPTLGFSHFFGLNDFFVTEGTLSEDAIAGTSGKIKVRSDIEKFPSKVAVGRVETEDPLATPAGGSVALNSGDSTILKELIAKFDSRVPFTDHLEEAPSTFNEFARLILSDQINNATLKKHLDEQTQVTYETLESKLEAKRGIDLVQELEIMSKAQLSYRAASRMTAEITDLLRELINSVR